MKDFQKQLEKQHGKKNISTKDIWEDENIQFPRHIVELEQLGVFQDNQILRYLSVCMDLNHDEILELVNRAIEKFDRIKSKL